MSSPSVLAVMAHPDDAELWVGGTLARHAAAGAATMVAVRAHDSIRNAEAIDGAAVLGAQLHLLQEMNPRTVADLITDLRPDIVITHAYADIHPDHRRTCRAVLDALPTTVISTGTPQRLYTCDSYNGLTLDGLVTPHTIIDISATFDQKMCALAVHRSQPISGHFGPMAETLARLHGSRIGTAYGEAFTALPVLGRLPAADLL